MFLDASRSYGFECKDAVWSSSTMESLEMKYLVLSAWWYETSIHSNTACALTATLSRIQYNVLFPGPSVPSPHPYPSVYELMAVASDVTRESAHWASPGMVSCPAMLHRDRKKPEKYWLVPHIASYCN